MTGMLYRVGVKTIDEIRLENYKRLTSEVHDQFGREPKGAELATELGISAAYVSQIKNNKRAKIEDEAARKMEAKRGKDRGWMDNDPDLWPFQIVSADRFSKLPERIKGMAEQAAKQIIDEWESSLGGALPEEEKLRDVA